MKIKLSQNQWKNIGKKAGWIKTIANSDQQSTSKKVCPECNCPECNNKHPINKKDNTSYPHECSECHGKKFIIEKIKNLGILEYTEHTSPCPSCNGKGYITKKDHDAYLHRVGLIPHPEDL